MGALDRPAQRQTAALPLIISVCRAPQRRQAVGRIADHVDGDRSSRSTRRRRRREHVPPGGSATVRAAAGALRLNGGAGRASAAPAAAGVAWRLPSPGAARPLRPTVAGGFCVAAPSPCHDVDHGAGPAAIRDAGRGALGSGGSGGGGGGGALAASGGFPPRRGRKIAKFSRLRRASACSPAPAAGSLRLRRAAPAGPAGADGAAVGVGGAALAAARGAAAAPAAAAAATTNGGGGGGGGGRRRRPAGPGGRAGGRWQPRPPHRTRPAPPSPRYRRGAGAVR
jgi:hypothetical protein